MYTDNSLTLLLQQMKTDYGQGVDRDSSLALLLKADENKGQEEDRQAEA